MLAGVSVSIWGVSLQILSSLRRQPHSALLLAARHTLTSQQEKLHQEEVCHPLKALLCLWGWTCVDVVGLVPGEPLEHSVSSDSKPAGSISGWCRL